jgi:hypothetical protein
MIIWFVCQFCNSVRGGDGIVYENLAMSLSVPKNVPLGSDVIFNLTLRSATTQSVYSLATADLLVTVHENSADHKDVLVLNLGRNRTLVKRDRDGERLELWVRVAKELELIGEGESSSFDISMLEEREVRPSCGEYSVSVVYESKVKAEATFSVVVDSDLTVPMLIDLIAGPDKWARSWARDALFSIVGRPTWKPSEDDTKELIVSEVNALRKWWEENKGKPVFLNGVKVVSVSGQATNAPPR